MKKTIWVVLLSMAFALVGCKYDDSELQDKVKDIDGRVTALENKVNDLNTTINGIQNSISALQNQLYVTKLVVNRDADGAPVSYDLTFSDGSVITLVKGLKGDQGDEGPRGEQGEVGPAPVMGIQEIDGLYYWTVEGELLKDAEGNPIPIVGPQGEQGVTPQFKIEEGSWWVSYDNEATWERVGLVSDTETSVIVTEFEDYIELDINGVKVNIPKEKPFTLVFEAREGLGVTKGVAVDFPYTIEGVAEGEQTEVDVYSIMGNWTAEAVATDAKSGVIKVTNTDDGTAKVFVYATNHKGKTDMVSLTFEGGVLVATCEVLEVPAEGGAYDLKVEYNVDYEIVVPDSADWIEVAPATKATQIKEYVINVAANETNAHRTATVQVVNKQTGESAKDIDVLQYPDPTKVTDLASIRALDDDTKVQANGSIVLAASQEGAVVSDGDAYIYITTESPVAVGDKVSFAGTKKTMEDTGVTYVETTSVSVESSGNEVPDMDWRYIGYGANFDSMNTGTSGLLQVDDAGAYFVQTPYIDKVQFETPLAALDMASYVGKYITVEGYTNGVNEDEEYNFIVNTVTEINFSVNPNWTLSHTGTQGNYEVITNTVAAGSTDYFAIYGMSLYTKEDVEEAGSVENLAKTEILNVADEIQFYFTRYNEGIEENASTATDYWYVENKVGFGEFVAFAVGLNEKGYPTGKYAFVEFEKENPYVEAKYEDFLGQWNVGKAVWTISEKVNGESYSVTGINGQETNWPVEALFVDGTFQLKEQFITEAEEGDIYLSGLMSVYGSLYVSYPFNSEVPDVLFTAAFLKEGPIEIIPGVNSKYGYELTQYTFITTDGEEVVDNTPLTVIPTTMTPYDPSVVVDPLQEEYTSADMVGEISKDELFAKTWAVYCRPLISGEYATDRGWFSAAMFAEAEDVAADEDRIVAKGLTLGVQQEDNVYLEYYGGSVYYLSQTAPLGTFTDPDTGTTYYDRFVAFNPVEGTFSALNYYNVIVKVGEGLFALIPNADDFTGFALLAYSDEAMTQPASWRLRYKDLLLVDRSIYNSPAAVNAAMENVDPSEVAAKAAKAMTAMQNRHNTQRTSVSPAKVQAPVSKFFETIGRSRR